MAYVFKGKLCGALCDECFEPLAGAKLRLYRLRDGQDATRLAVADAKDTFAVLTDDQVQAKQSALLGEFDVDDAGGFAAALDKASGYGGEAFEIDVYCGTVPHRRPEPPPHGGVQFSITTLQPQWRQREGDWVAAWDHCLSRRFWCHVRALFDAWVICGQVTVCATGVPAEGVRVFAFDRDWLADDPLGSAFTDASGRFRIDYLGADFRRGTWLNIELVGGPDVYFRIETASGTVLLNEPSAMGRGPGRENIGPCFCTRLCVEQAPVVTHAWFTRVGDFSINSDINTATGRTLTAQPSGFPNQHGGPDYGFFGNLKLVGDCPVAHPVTAQAMRYRFLWRPTGSAAAPMPLTGAGMVVAQKVGTRPVPWNFGMGVLTYPQDVWVVPTGGYTGPQPAPLPPAPLGPPPGTWGPMPPLLLMPDADGWVTLPTDATNGGLSGPLLCLASAGIVPGGAAPAPTAGDPVLLANQRHGSDVQILFEAQPVSGPGATLGNDLPRLHINNWAEVAEFNLVQFSAPGATPCDGISNAVDMRFTLDHDLLADWQLSLSTSASIPGGTPVLPPSAVPPGSTVVLSGRGGSGVVHLDTTAWPACAYMVVFSRRLRLTNGESDDPGRGPAVAVFCKR